VIVNVAGFTIVDDAKSQVDTTVALNARAPEITIPHWKEQLKRCLL